jgi:hypothetical protein
MGICLTCNGTGIWYKDSPQEEKCASCAGEGRCPECYGIPNFRAKRGREAGS